jgi:hypothetical protein
MVGIYLAYLLMLQVTCWLRTCVKCRGLYLASFACGLVIRVILLGFFSRVPSECQPILDQGLPNACRNGAWIEDADFCIIVCPKFWAEECILIIYIQCLEVMGVIDCLVLCEWYSQVMIILFFCFLVWPETGTTFVLLPYVMFLWLFSLQCLRVSGSAEHVLRVWSMLYHLVVYAVIIFSSCCWLEIRVLGSLAFFCGLQ